MNFGKRTDAKTAEHIIHSAFDQGVVHFDTANAYCDGDSERILGRALSDRRDKVLVASKVGFGRTAGKPEGLSPARVKAACEESLSRLGMDYVDIYYLHVPDYDTPLADTLGAIGELLKVGKIRAFGVSNYASWQIGDINHTCDELGIARPIISQTLYNMLIRQLDLEYARFLQHHPIHNTVYNALAGGLLSGRFTKAEAAPKGSRFFNNRLYQGRYWSSHFFDAVEAYRAVAEKQDMTLSDLAYAWLAGSPVVDSILIGPATKEQLDNALRAVEVPLGADVRAKIDEIHTAFRGTESSYAR